MLIPIAFNKANPSRHLTSHIAHAAGHVISAQTQVIQNSING